MSNSEQYKNRLDQVLAYAKSEGYQGYSKFDAMNSPFLEKLFGWHPLNRLVWIQAVNRSPINLRKIFKVQKSRNPKGIANFIKALSCRYELNPEEDIKQEASKLHSWLMENQAKDYYAWGYNFPWENPGFYAPRFYPNAIVSVFCAEAFLKAYQVFKEEKYLESAQKTADFLINDLPVLIDEEDKKCLGYIPKRPKLRVVNINSVMAGYLAKLTQEIGEERYLKEAQKMINWVMSVKTDYDAWFYTDPPTSYVRNHDNYHSGGILDGLFDFISVTQDENLKETYLRGLEYYKTALFEDDGAPKWRSHKSYPYDIHGSAQGILSFAKAAKYDPGYLDLAYKIADWADANLSAPTGGFYYQKHRFFTMKFELMRWNNSWMSWALAELCLATNECAE